jgi:hypothetical protein
VVDFGEMCAGDPAIDLAACWILLPDGVIGRFHQSYSPAADAATLRRARGWARRQALGLLSGDAGVHGHPGGKATRGPPAQAALQRLAATRPWLSRELAYYRQRGRDGSSSRPVGRDVILLSVGVVVAAEAQAAAGDLAG